ncbi:MAG TPA: hypothetical protein PLM29_14040, partial [Deltaproteobacteria bacterium]|nr:hypothetical protein [Deltaproteobacteria bacterium]
MSATPPEGIHDIFRDESNEPIDPHHPLGARQLASKPSRLIPLDEEGMGLAKQIQEKRKELKKAEGERAGRYKLSEYRRQLIELEGKASELLAQEIVSNALTLAQDEPVATIIFVNRVDTARVTHALLMEKCGDNAVLLTGRMRPIDKDDIVKQKLADLSAKISDSRKLDKPIFVVATQTLEVGADLDFDVLVTECASLDALRQRFGRLNRMGRDIVANASILIRAGQDKNSDDDPVYGSSLVKTWGWLNHQAGRCNEIDMGISALSKCLQDEKDLAELNAPANHAPVMLPAHIDCWAQTFPEPEPTPEAALFLHGPRSGPADVQICWREDLIGNDFEAWEDAVSLCPPTSPECLSVSFAQIRSWIRGKEDFGAEADVEGLGAQMNNANAELPGHIRHVVRWRGRNDISVVRRSNDMLPGDVVVIPAMFKGWDELATLGTKSPVLDWGDRAYAQSSNRALLRVHPEVMKHMPGTDSLKRLSEIGVNAGVLWDEDPDGLIQELKMVLSDIGNDDETPKWLRVIAANLSVDKRLSKGIIPHPTGGLILKGSPQLHKKSYTADDLSEEDDDLSSGTVHVQFSDHLDGVALYAERFARYCGFSEELKGIYH